MTRSAPRREDSRRSLFVTVVLHAEPIARHTHDMKGWNRLWRSNQTRESDLAFSAGYCLDIAVTGLPVGLHAVIFAIGPVHAGLFPAKMEIRRARIANRPLANPIGYGIQGADERLRRNRPRR